MSKKKKKQNLKNKSRPIPMQYDSLEEMLEEPDKSKNVAPRNLLIIHPHNSPVRKDLINEEQFSNLIYYKNPESIYQLIAYFIDNEKGEPEYNPKRAGGIRCLKDPRYAISNMFTILHKYNVSRGRYLYQFIMESKLFDDISFSSIHSIVTSALKVFDDEYLIFYYIHGKRKHGNVHVHISLLPINIYSGKRLHLSNEQFYHLQDDMNFAAQNIYEATKRDFKQSKKKKKK